jgi:hypothetical protein
MSTSHEGTPDDFWFALRWCTEDPVIRIVDSIHEDGTIPDYDADGIDVDTLHGIYGSHFDVPSEVRS